MDSTEKYQHKASQRFYFGIKRLIDIFGSLIGIILFATLFWWWIAIVIKCTSKGPIFFKQKRLGKHKKEFTLLKFRSMSADAPEIPPSEMTPEQRKQLEYGFGKFLRKTSLDETAQLLNIFIGSMSFIGPRPGAAKNEEDLVVQREAYTPNAFDVKPGLGGYAQWKMNRRHEPDGKARYDAEYAKNVSFWLDVKIFFGTIWMVLINLKYAK